MHFSKASAAAATIAATVFSSSAFGCAGCGCTLSSDWDSQGFVTKPGIRLDLRYDYLDQKQLRSGGGKTNPSSLIGTGHEIEKITTNHYVTAGIDYSLNQDWGINVQIPYIDRYHETYGEVDAPDTLGTVPLGVSHTKSIGDVKVVGRYLGFSDNKNFGVQFGLKLPTGDHTRNFKDGTPLDRGLQPGTGTTDLMLGAYHFNAINQDWDYFAQGMVQVALNSRDDYRPGNALNVNVGVRYVANDLFTPQLQVNAKTSQHDSGANADRPNSGGTLAYLSPGLTVNLENNLKLYGFVQVPIYQHVDGYQLTPRWTGTLGVRYTF